MADVPALMEDFKKRMANVQPSVPNAPPPDLVADFQQRVAASQPSRPPVGAVPLQDEGPTLSPQEMQNFLNAGGQLEGQQTPMTKTPTSVLTGKPEDESTRPRSSAGTTQRDDRMPRTLGESLTLGGRQALQKLMAMGLSFRQAMSALAPMLAMGGQEFKEQTAGDVQDMQKLYQDVASENAAREATKKPGGIVGQAAEGLTSSAPELALMAASGGMAGAVRKALGPILGRIGATALTGTASDIPHAAEQVQAGAPIGDIGRDLLGSMLQVAPFPTGPGRTLPMIGQTVAEGASMLPRMAVGNVLRDTLTGKDGTMAERLKASVGKELDPKQAAVNALTILALHAPKIAGGLAPSRDRPAEPAAAAPAETSPTLPQPSAPQARPTLEQFMEQKGKEIHDAAAAQGIKVRYVKQAAMKAEYERIYGQETSDAGGTGTQTSQTGQAEGTQGPPGEGVRLRHDEQAAPAAPGQSPPEGAKPPEAMTSPIAPGSTIGTARGETPAPATDRPAEGTPATDIAPGVPASSAEPPSDASVVTGKPDDPRLMAGMQASTREVREQFGMERITSPQRKADLDLLQQAKAEIPEDQVMRIVTEAGATGRQLSDTETVRLVGHGAKLKAELGRLPKDSEEYRRVEQDLDDLTFTLDRAGTAWGRAGRARQLWLNEAMDKPIIMRIAAKRRAAKGLPEMTEDVRQRLSDMADDVQAKQMTIDDLNHRIDWITFDKIVDRSRMVERLSEQERGTLVEKAIGLLRAGCNLN
jgi:hypothetical protein